MQLFSAVARWFSGETPQSKQLYAQVEQLLEQVEPRLKQRSDYRQRLAPGVAQVHEHVDRLCQSLPAPVTVALDEYSQLPELDVMFPSEEALQALLQESDALTEWAGEQMSAADCYGLLAVRYEEFQKLGPALEHGRVIQDVLQTVLRFDHYRLLCLAAEPAEVITLARLRALDEYGEQALISLSQMNARLEQLKSEQKQLQIRLKLRQQGHQGLSVGLGDEQQTSMSRQELEQALADIEQQLADMGYTAYTLDAEMALLEAFVSDPTAVFDFGQQDYLLDRNQVLTTPGDSAGRPVSWLRITRNQTQHHALIPVKLPAAELRRLGIF